MERVGEERNKERKSEGERERKRVRQLFYLYPVPQMNRELNIHTRKWSPE